ncbi:hypothetical protein [Paludibacter sp.]|uniref:hypothetical protein n=1 Tax=Paludibacter sp. TaxID=1898105 RepID=UPI0025EFCCB0|nr:hypothetical protein [Paludibacter sp.]
MGGIAFSGENIKTLPFGEGTYSVMHFAISADGLVWVFHCSKAEHQTNRRTE